MSMSGVRYRNESKYFVSANSLDVVENRLKNLIHLDPYVDKEKGFYIVKSLYFDDYDDTCLNHNKYSLGRRKNIVSACMETMLS